MSRKRISLLLLTLLLVPIFLTACWDRTEVNDIAIVVASSIDLEENGQYRVSVQVPLPGQLGGSGSSGGGGGTSGEKGYYVDSAVGSTVREANDKVQQRMSRRLFMGHRRVLIIGEELARKVGIRQLFDVITRVPENRLTASIVVAKGKGYELLNAQPRFERYSSEAIREILQSESVINVTMKDASQWLSKRGADPIVPYLAPVKSQKGEKNSIETQFLGYAQFHGGKLVDVLQGDAAIGLHWARQNFKPYLATLNVGKIGPVTLNVYKGDIKITPSLTPTHVHFDVKTDAYAYLIETLSDADFELEANVKQVENALNDSIHEAILMTLNSVKTYETDSASLGLTLARRYPRQWTERYSQDWYAELHKATFSIHTSATLERVGLVSRNPAALESGK
ncbi:MAG: Ger(x)C family spore germination protein [Tumebacillaceae bacterium]